MPFNSLIMIIKIYYINKYAKIRNFKSKNFCKNLIMVNIKLMGSYTKNVIVIY